MSQNESCASATIKPFLLKKYTTTNRYRPLVRHKFTQPLYTTDATTDANDREDGKGAGIVDNQNNDNDNTIDYPHLVAVAVVDTEDGELCGLDESPAHGYKQVVNAKQQKNRQILKQQRNHLKTHVKWQKKKKDTTDRAILATPKLCRDTVAMDPLTKNRQTKQAARPSTR